MATHRQGKHIHKQQTTTQSIDVRGYEQSYTPKGPFSFSRTYDCASDDGGTWARARAKGGGNCTFENEDGDRGGLGWLMVWFGGRAGPRRQAGVKRELRALLRSEWALWNSKRVSETLIPNWKRKKSWTMSLFCVCLWLLIEQLRRSWFVNGHRVSLGRLRWWRIVAWIETKTWGGNQNLSRIESLGLRYFDLVVNYLSS